jgi:hypothetical protein
MVIQVESATKTYSLNKLMTESFLIGRDFSEGKFSKLEFPFRILNFSKIQKLAKNWTQDLINSYL